MKFTFKPMLASLWEFLATVFALLPMAIAVAVLTCLFLIIASQLSPKPCHGDCRYGDERCQKMCLKNHHCAYQGDE